MSPKHERSATGQGPTQRARPNVGHATTGPTATILPCLDPTYVIGSAERWLWQPHSNQQAPHQSRCKLWWSTNTAIWPDPADRPTPISP
jgi:hypothetical protein